MIMPEWGKSDNALTGTGIQYSLFIFQFISIYKMGISLKTIYQDMWVWLLFTAFVDRAALAKIGLKIWFWKPKHLDANMSSQIYPMKGYIYMLKQSHVCKKVMLLYENKHLWASKIDPSLQRKIMHGPIFDEFIRLIWLSLQTILIVIKN